MPILVFLARMWASKLVRRSLLVLIVAAVGAGFGVDIALVEQFLSALQVVAQ